MTHRDVIHEADGRGPQSDGKRRLAESELEEVLAVTGGGSATETIAGAGGAVLAMLGLAGVLPFYMMLVAAIAIGAGMFLEGTSLGAASARLERQIREDEDLALGGLTVMGLAGAAGLTLGILSLLGIVPGVLLSVAVLVMAAGMIFGGPSRAELNLNALAMRGASSRALELAWQAVRTSEALLTLVGALAGVLGVLSLAGVPSPQTLNLLALLGMGGASFLSGSAVLGKVRVATREH